MFTTVCLIVLIVAVLGIFAAAMRSMKVDWDIIVTAAVLSLLPFAALAVVTVLS